MGRRDKRRKKERKSKRRDDRKKFSEELALRSLQARLRGGQGGGEVGCSRGGESWTGTGS